LELCQRGHKTLSIAAAALLFRATLLLLLFLREVRSCCNSITSATFSPSPPTPPHDQLHQSLHPSPSPFGNDANPSAPAPSRMPWYPIQALGGRRSPIYYCPCRRLAPFAHPLTSIGSMPLSCFPSVSFCVTVSC
jgi:hypothetical protein